MQSPTISPFQLASARVSDEAGLRRIQSMNGTPSTARRSATETYVRTHTVQQEGVTVTHQESQARHTEARAGHPPRPPSPQLQGEALNSSSSSEHKVSSGSDRRRRDNETRRRIAEQRRSRESQRSSIDDTRASTETKESNESTVAVGSTHHLTMQQLEELTEDGYRSRQSREAAMVLRDGRRQVGNQMRERRRSAESHDSGRVRDVEMGRFGSSGDDDLPPSSRHPSIQVTINQGNMGSGGIGAPVERPSDPAEGGADGLDEDGRAMRGLFFGYGPRVDTRSKAYAATVGILQGITYVAAGGGGLALVATVIHNAVKVNQDSPSMDAMAPSPF